MPNLNATEKAIVTAITAILTVAVSLGIVTSTIAQVLIGVVPTLVVVGVFIIDGIEHNTATQVALATPVKATRAAK